MRKLFVIALVSMLVVAMVGGVAQAKGKPAPKKGPLVTYVFNGTVESVDRGSVVVSVQSANKVGSSYAGTQVDFLVNERTRTVEDDAKTVLSELDSGERVVVQLRAPKSGASSFLASKIVAESSRASNYFDADADGLGAGEARATTLQAKSQRAT